MNKSNSISFRRYYEKRHLLLAIAALSLTCNTITFAQSESNPNSNSAIATPTNIKELSGKPIDFSHYKDYITTDRPSEATGKMFLLYNIGTGKFLNMYRAQNEAYKIEKTKKWEKSMNDRELER